MTTNNNIVNILGLDDDIPSNQSIVELIPIKNANSEYDLAKGNMEGIIEFGAQNLNELSRLAITSQDPRMFRVFTELFAAMITANKELVSIKQIKVDTDNKENSKKNDTTIHNNLFVGSTAELTELLEKKKEQLNNV